MITKPQVLSAAETVETIKNEAPDFISKLITRVTDAVPTIIFAVAMLVIGVLAARLITYFISKAFRRSRMDSAAQGFLTSLIKIILYIIVIMMALSMLNVPMSSIITVFGAAGLAVSLALQNCLTNLCGGFIILFSKPFSAGDTIEIDSSTGVVKSISILYTKITTFDNKTVLIPNGKVSDAKIINYTELPDRRVELRFDISYDADYDKARGIIMRIIESDSLILSDPAPVVRMKEHKESAISIDTLVWTKNETYNDVIYNLNERVKSEFDKNNIEIPYNKLDVCIKERI